MPSTKKVKSLPEKRNKKPEHQAKKSEAKAAKSKLTQTIENLVAESPDGKLNVKKLCEVMLDKSETKSESEKETTMTTTTNTANNDIVSVTPAMFKNAELLETIARRAALSPNKKEYYVDLRDMITAVMETASADDAETLQAAKDFVELKLKVEKEQVEEKVFNEFNKQAVAIKENREAILEKEARLVGTNHWVKPQSTGVSGNVKAAVAGGVAGAAASLIWDFAFGTDQTTEEMLIDAGISAGIGAAAGYSAALLADMEYSDSVSSSAVGVAMGVMSSAGYRAAVAVFQDNDASDVEEMETVDLFR